MDILTVTYCNFCSIISPPHTVLYNAISSRELSMPIVESFLLLVCLHIGVTISTKWTRIFAA